MIPRNAPAATPESARGLLRAMLQLRQLDEVRCHAAASSLVSRLVAERRDANGMSGIDAVGGSSTGT